MNPDTLQQRPHDSLPSDTYVNDDGDVTVPHDAGAEVSDEFGYDENESRLELWEAEAAAAGHQEAVADRTEQGHDPRADIEAQLAAIAVKTYVKLSDKIIDAHQRGDLPAKHQALAKLNELAARFPGLVGPEDETTPSQDE